MDALNFPRPIAPVAAGHRVQKSRPRKDSGQGFRFAKHLRQKARPPDASGDDAEEDDGGPAAPAIDAARAEGEEAPGGETSSPPKGRAAKLIDIRV
jgi:hypothetical protein